MRGACSQTWGIMSVDSSLDRTAIAFLLVLTRVGALFAFVPIPGSRSFPAAPKVVLTMAVTAMLVKHWTAPAGLPQSIPALAAAMGSEALLGVGAGLGVAMLAEASQLCAQFIGLQAGFSYASTIDPNSEADSTILLIVFQLLSSLLVFACGLDRLILASLASSFDRFPVGAMVVDASRGIGMVEALGTTMFQLSFRLAMPVIGVLLVADVSLALLGKIEQHLQLGNLLFPVKTLIALAIAAVALSGSSRLLERWFLAGWPLIERALFAAPAP